MWWLFNCWIKVSKSSQGGRWTSSILLYGPLDVLESLISPVLLNVTRDSAVTAPRSVCVCSVYIIVLWGSPVHTCMVTLVGTMWLRDYQTMISTNLALGTFLPPISSYSYFPKPRINPTGAFSLFGVLLSLATRGSTGTVDPALRFEELRSWVEEHGGFVPGLPTKSLVMLPRDIFNTGKRLSQTADFNPFEPSNCDFQVLHITFYHVGNTWLGGSVPGRNILTSTGDWKHGLPLDISLFGSPLEVIYTCGYNSLSCESYMKY